MEIGGPLSLMDTAMSSLPPKRAALGGRGALGGLQCKVERPPGATFEQRWIW